MNMKILKKGWAVEKRGGGNEIHAPCVCAPAYLLIRNEGGINSMGVQFTIQGVNIPWESKYHMTPVLSSFMTYHRICNQINTSTTSGAGTAFRSTQFQSRFLVGFVLHDL